MSLGIFLVIFVDVLLLFYALGYFFLTLIPSTGGYPTSPLRRARSGPPSSLRQRIEQICLSMDRWTGHASKGHSEIKERLMQAGFRSPAAPAVFYTLTLCGAVLLPGLLGLFLWGSIGVHRHTLLIPLIWAGAGFMLPRLALRSKVERRQEVLLLALPQALDLLVVGVEAGFSLDAALQRVSEELARSQPELSEEFRLLLFELRAGWRRREAFCHLMDRTGLDEIGSLVATLIQADEQGGQLATALRGFSRDLRFRRKQAAEERAAKIPVKLTFPTFFFIFPGLFIVIAAPAMIRLLRELMPMLHR